LNQMAKAFWLGLERSDMFVHFFSTGMTQDDWPQQLEGVPNPPIWTLGHLAYQRAYFLEMVTGKKTYDETWVVLFELGCEPHSVNEYPDPETCFGFMKARLLDFKAYLETASIEDLESPPIIKSKFFPTKASVLIHLTHHEAHHTGGLAIMRRLLGKERLL
jgi:uncharacterized damage-inducible protein DinB